MFTFLAWLPIIARGGGGGSGGGGGGGGLLYFVGYFPIYYMGKLTKKFLPRKIELAITATITGILSALLLLLAIILSVDTVAGVFIIGIIIFGMWSGWAAAFFGLWDKIRKRSKQANLELAEAEKLDPAWNKQDLLKHTKDTFVQFQQDWSSFNTKNMAKYLKPNLLKHNILLLRILSEMKRSNQMNNLEIENMLLVDVNDTTDNSKDRFTIAIKAKAKDVLIDTTKNTVIFQDDSPFTEFWTFNRSSTTWLLENIKQATQQLNALQKSLLDFANKNYMFFSLDMGWLFLPKRGQLFKYGGFGKSDINNHVVGTYHDHLVQFYTYTSDPRAKNPGNSLVAQINLPKSYGGIVIRRKPKNMFSFIYTDRPKGYKKYTFEWPDFNDRYEVFATDRDRLATFELLNPGFMAYLYDSDTNINIEVTDNVVFLYKPATNASAPDYQKMLTVLMKAFKELKL